MGSGEIFDRHADQLVRIVEGYEHYILTGNVEALIAARTAYTGDSTMHECPFPEAWRLARIAEDTLGEADTCT